MCILQRKKLWWEAGKRFVKIKISAKTLRTINKNGLEAVAKEHDINLSALPYVDCSEARIQWKASQPKRPPMAKKPRCDITPCTELYNNQFPGCARCPDCVTAGPQPRPHAMFAWHEALQRHCSCCRLSLYFAACLSDECNT